MAKITAKQKQKLLDELATGRSIAGSAKAAGIGPSTVRAWRQEGHKLHDPDFAALADQAIEDGTDSLEDHAEERARNGSDVLTIFLLKGRRPTKYRDNAKIEHVGKNDGPIQGQVEVKGVSLSDVLDIARRAGAAPPGPDS